MGFFDRDVENGSDEMFDWNNDVKLDSFEWNNQLEFEQRMPEEDLGSEIDDEGDDIELELAGLDRFDLEMMDEDERRGALEDAGLDSDDFDF